MLAAIASGDCLHHQILQFDVAGSLAMISVLPKQAKR
jgi:hypothetical protein